MTDSSFAQVFEASSDTFFFSDGFLVDAGRLFLDALDSEDWPGRICLALTNLLSSPFSRRSVAVCVANKANNWKLVASEGSGIDLTRLAERFDLDTRPFRNLVTHNVSVSQSTEASEEVSVLVIPAGDGPRNLFVVAPPISEAEVSNRLLLSLAGLLAHLRVFPQPSLNSQPPISPRQLKLLWGLLSGYRNGELANLLGVSDSTVKREITELLRIFSVSSRKELERLPRAQVIAASHDPSQFSWRKN